jgi:uncharacterized LabA/DUF88 family protein
MPETPPPRPRPTRVVLFVDCQNLYNRCRDRFGWPWVHPIRLGEELVAADVGRYGTGSHCLAGVRYYTGIHDPNKRPKYHGKMDRRLQAYAAAGVRTFSIPVRYDNKGRAREKGVDVRIAIDLTRLGQKGLYDVAIVVSEDSDLNPAISDVYGLRDGERWIAVENALPYAPGAPPKWLSAAHRTRRIDAAIFARIRDDKTY